MAHITSRRGKITVYWKDGRGKRHVKVCSSQQEAEHLAAQVSGPEHPEMVTLGQWGESWLNGLRQHVLNGALKILTFGNYERLVRCHIQCHRIGQQTLASVQRKDLRAWVNDMIGEKASPKTISNRVACIRVLFRDAKEEGLIRENPALELVRAMRLPSAPKKQKAFSDPEQEAAFLEAVAFTPEGPSLLLMAFTGLRIGEALGLQWQDVDLERAKAKVVRQVLPINIVGTPKSDAGSRDIDLPSGLVELMREWRKIEPLSPWVLGYEPKECHKVEQRIRVRMTETLKGLGLPHLTPHSLRHSIATFRATLGHDLRLVADQLGHESTAVTRLYTHVQRSDSAAADAVGNLIRPKKFAPRA